MQIKLTATSIINIEVEIKKIINNSNVFKTTTNNTPLVWVICSDEIFLKRRVNEAIKKSVYPETKYSRMVRIPQLNFDWDNCLNEAKNFSLFSEKKLFDIRLGSGKPGTKGSKALMEWCENLPNLSDFILDIPSIDYASKKSNWFSTIDKYGLIINIPSPNDRELKKWLEKTFTLSKIPFSQEAIDLIVERCSGNLSMAAQEIQKIILLLDANKKPISLDKNFIQKTVANVAKFNPFDLPDLIFKIRNKKSCIELISGLKEEDFPMTLIIWILSQACRSQNLQNKKRLLKKLSLIDKILKGLIPGDPWIELELFVLQDKKNENY